MKRYYTDRSRIQQSQRCPRSRYLAYHQDQTGIRGCKMPLPLAVGLSVHVGLEYLLRSAQRELSRGGLNVESYRAASKEWEEGAVAAALRDFSQYTQALDTGEQDASTAAQTEGATMVSLLAQSLGMDAAAAAKDAMVTGLAERVGQSQQEYDGYLAREQVALVEALVRAYARRRLRPLLEQYEVLEVEREGQWRLAEVPHCIHADDMGYQSCGVCGFQPNVNADFDATCWQLWFMSRPDALLLDRHSRELYILSYKTTGQWDHRKEKDAQHDMQGLSEGVEIERRLGEWWQRIHKDMDASKSVGRQVTDFTHLRDSEGCTGAMFAHLRDLPAPPRILGIRYEFMLKGERWKDKELSQRYGMDVRSQRSHLVRCYEGHGKGVGVNWSWEYLKPDGSGEQSKLAWQQWKSQPVWERIDIKTWIDSLDTATMVQSGEDAAEGMAPRDLGYQSNAQITGYTAEHPLDAVFIPPIIVYRNDDELRDLVEQIESQEVAAVQHVQQIDAARDEGERRSLLNRYFPQHREHCENDFGRSCQFVPICYGGSDIRARPLESGRYKRREANHPAEFAKEPQ